MATKLSSLTALAAAPDEIDELYIRDESESASAESKRITLANLRLGVLEIANLSELAVAPDTTDEVFISDAGTIKRLSVANLHTDVVAAGNYTNTTLPAFLFHNSVINTDVTGDTTTYTVEFNAEIFDQGSDFNDVTDTFTAPVTGLYQFNTVVEVSGILNTADLMTLRIQTSNRHYYWAIGRTNELDSQRGNALSCVADMDSGDTAIVTIKLDGQTLTADVQGHATIILTYFSGFLLA